MSGNELLSADLTALNGALSHDGRPGMKWYRHKYGPWQSHAAYAGGMPDPEANRKEGSSNSNEPLSKKQLEEKYKASLRSRRDEGIKTLEEGRKKVSDMSTEELNEAIARLETERNFNNALQNKMRSDLAYRQLEKEYQNAFTIPEKKGFFKSTFEKMTNKAQDAIADTAITVAKNYTLAKAHKMVADKFGDDVANALFSVNQGGGKKKKGGQNQQNQQNQNQNQNQNGQKQGGNQNQQNQGQQNQNPQNSQNQNGQNQGGGQSKKKKHKQNQNTNTN